MDDFAAAAGAKDRPHFQEQVEGRPHLVRSEFGEAFGTVAALDQEGAPGGHSRELRPEMHDIGDLREWRGGGETGLDPAPGAGRSEARRVGKACVSTGRSRRSPYPSTKNNITEITNINKL